MFWDGFGKVARRSKNVEKYIFQNAWEYFPHVGGIKIRGFEATRFLGNEVSRQRGF